MSGRKLLTRRGALLLALALVGLLGAWWALSRQEPGRVAVVEVHGAGTARVALSSLSGPREETFAGEGGHTVTVEFTSQGAQVVWADCPDQVCVHTGELTRAGEAAVCLPARIVLRLEGGEKSAVDGVTG